MTPTTEVKLGDTARDTVTGFEGTVTARIDYLSQPPQLCLEALRTDGGVSTLWFGVERVEIAPGL